MNRSLLNNILFSSVLILSASSALAGFDKGEREAFGKAKISAQKAIEIASDKNKSVPISAEFDTTLGNGYWEVTVVQDQKIREYYVSADSGKVIAKFPKYDFDDVALKAELEKPGYYSLVKAIDTVEQTTKGKVYEADVDHENGALVIEAKVLLPDNRTQKFNINAKDGQVAEEIDD